MVVFGMLPYDALSATVMQIIFRNTYLKQTELRITFGGLQVIGQSYLRA